MFWGEYGGHSRGTSLSRFNATVFGAPAKLGAMVAVHGATKCYSHMKTGT